MSKRDLIFRRFLGQILDPQSRGIEIGPYDRPFLPRADYPRVEYADVFTTEELRKHAAANPLRDSQKVVPVDHVLKDRRMSDFIEENSMQFVFCSHVLEHVPDMIDTLKDIETILQPGGLFICAYPDRRYTFDIDRDATTFEQLKTRNLRKATRPDPETVYDYFVNYRKVFVGRIWQDLPGERGEHLYNEQIAREKADLAKEQYVDVHCNIFSDDEMQSIIKQMKTDGTLNLDVFAFQNTAAPLNEFFFALKKSD